MTISAEPSSSAPARLVRILAISDEVDERLYSPGVAARFRSADLLLSCGDLPDYYLDFVASMLNVPLYGVRGNHDARPPSPSGLAHHQRWGMVDLHARVVEDFGLLMGGLDGSMRYSRGAYQYTEGQMREQVARMVPRLLLNRVRYGRFLDIFVTHASPRGIHDQADQCHQGFDVFRWFLRTFRPRYHLHGHVHVYDNRTPTETQYHDTLVLNAYRYRELSVPVVGSR